MRLSVWLIIFGIFVLVAIIYLLFADRLKRFNVKASSAVIDSRAVFSLKDAQDARIIDDYNVYRMSFKEKLINIILAAMFIIAVGLVFYRNIYLSVLFTPLALFYPKIKLKSIIKKRKERLLLQFKEALYLISSSLSAGKSVESAMSDTVKDLESLLSKQENYIIREFKYITSQLALNQNIEEVMTDFAHRSKVEDIANFADVFVVSKRTGGNLIEAIKNSVKVIAEKIEFKQELNTMLAQKKFEQKLLSIIPVVLVLLLTWTAPDYMEPVFTTFIGRVVMTVAVAILIFAYFISKKIMEIEI